jgi:hypothetical protein
VIGKHGAGIERPSHATRVVRVKAKEMVMKWTIFLALVLSVAMGSCVRTQQGIVGTGTYQVLDLGVHPGFDTSEPSGMNSLGQYRVSRSGPATHPGARSFTIHHIARESMWAPPSRSKPHRKR